jgi:hypothetical protein
VDSGATSIDSRHASRSNYGSLFECRFTNLSKHSSLARTSFTGQEDRTVGELDKFFGNFVNSHKILLLSLRKSKQNASATP